MRRSKIHLALVGCALFSLLVHTSPTLAQTLEIAWELDEGASGSGVALGDVDLDGDLDIYVSDENSPDRLWLNDGSGFFVDSGQSLQDGRSFNPTLVRLDADLYPDLWLNFLVSASSAWMNDGSGNLALDQSYGALVTRRHAGFGDLDDDGDIDIFLPSDNNSFANEILFNDGMGNFTDSGQSPGTFTSRVAALGDVDGDDDLDAFIGNNGSNKLLLNDGEGVFSDSGLLNIGIQSTYDAAFADLDGDENLDLFLANGAIGGLSNEVWLGDGAGGFTDSGQALGKAFSLTLVLADFNDDDDIDIFVGNNTGEENVLYANDGNGTFTPTNQDFGIGGAGGAAGGDLNGDGDVDLVLSDSYQPTQIFFNSPTGFQESSQLLGSNAGLAAELGDFDQDGDLDAVVGSTGGVMRILLNDGAGVFNDSGQWLGNGAGQNTLDVEVGDVDGDLDLDIVAGNTLLSFAGDQVNRLWINDGQGNFTDSGQDLGDGKTACLELGDIDGDLDLDLFVGNAVDNRVFFNDGSGVFTAGIETLGTTITFDCRLADLDGDEDLDLVLGNTGAANEIWLGDGDGTFTDIGQLLGLLDTKAIVLWDLDRDGDLDLVAGNTSAGDTVWLNDGDANFTDTGQSLGFRNTVDLHIADFNADGHADIWATNGDGGAAPNEIWLGDGTGIFSDSGLDFGNSASSESALGDLDGDGLRDIFVVNRFGDHRAWKQIDTSIFRDDFESGDTTEWSQTQP